MSADTVAGRRPPRLAPATHLRRLVVYDAAADARLHAGRAALRRTVLGWSPVRSSGGLWRAPDAGSDGVFWGLVAPNGLALALRVRDVATAGQARADAAELLARADELVAHRVAQPGTGRTSLWLSLDGRVVLVGGQVWRRSDGRAERTVLRALGHGGRWWPEG